MENKKPIAKVTGRDNNVFVTLGICSQALKKSGMRKEADEMVSRVMTSSSYDEAIWIMGEYCDLR